MWKDLIYIWLVYLKVTGKIERSWKMFSEYYPGELPQPSKAGQHSNPRYTENSTKIFIKKSHPKKAHNHQVHQGWSEGKNAKGSQRERSGHPQREAHQTHRGFLSGNPTSQKIVGADIQHTKRKELSTQNLISSQSKLHKWRRNKILYGQAITERFCYHQTCLVRAPERNTKHGKEQVPAIAKAYEMEKTNNIMKNLSQLMGKKTSQ